MATIEHNSISYEVSGDGFLLNGSEEWDENWVDYVKSVEKVEGNSRQLWMIIDAIRSNLKNNPKHITSILHKEDIDLDLFFSVFPENSLTVCKKITGMSKS